MREILLRPYQVEAIDAIQKAVTRGQKHIVIEMPVGSGKSLVFAKTVELLNKSEVGRILVVTGHMIIKEQIEKNLSTNYQGFIQTNIDNIVVETEQRILRHYKQKLSEYQLVIFYDAAMPKNMYEMFSCKEKTVIVFSTINNKIPHRFITPKEIVFSYTYQQAIDAGYITPAMDEKAFNPAVEVFSKQLLEEFGYKQIDYCSDMQDCGWDLVVQKGNQKIWVECKSYKSQVVSPSVANSLLTTTIMKKMEQRVPQEDVILLIVLSKIPSFQKEEIYDRHRIIVWDIENLVFYSKNNPVLLKRLSQITYFPLDHIEGKCFEKLETVGLSLNCVIQEITQKEEIIQEAEKERSETRKLIQRLKECKTGQEYSGEYEKICEEIIRNLFEAHYFNRLTSQHKTNDEHFRMDLIGSLKITQNNEESMHPLWQMLVQHYNSHFVVFEFKNYSKKIDQNLIYTTEKYLFDAALRKVAIIISRKGFSEAAKFAAEGCLKEHGKMILDITDNDLIEMLQSKRSNAADYLLDKLEEFLMGISK